MSSGQIWEAMLRLDPACRKKPLEHGLSVEECAVCQEGMRLRRLFIAAARREKGLP